MSIKLMHHDPVRNSKKKPIAALLYQAMTCVINVIIVAVVFYLFGYFIQWRLFENDGVKIKMPRECEAI